eukprot:TRINITY_DN320_c0_g3_i1.p1 TRINITY_DN320_c0_g3~~TRINITY_DN320_c0_g3_i1.p1  ORF type:complete len:291 (+),score=58.78 TRINITY_DN320_c0_g3_i1:11-883(+)
MSLFVGNISRNVKTKDLEEDFEKLGKCRVNHKGSFAFVEYDDEKCAEEAIKELHDKDMGGLHIRVEWSKKSRKFDSKDSHRPPRRDLSDIKCFSCNGYGHFARECTQKRTHRRSHSRSRSKSGSRSHSRRKQRSRSRSKDRRKSRSRSHDRSRSASPASPPKKSSREQREKSHSGERKKSRSSHSKERSNSSDRDMKHKREDKERPVKEKEKDKENHEAEKPKTEEKPKVPETKGAGEEPKGEKKSSQSNFEIHWRIHATTNLYPLYINCLLYTSPSPRDATLSRMPSSA